MTNPIARLGRIFLNRLPRTFKAHPACSDAILANEEAMTANHQTMLRPPEAGRYIGLSTSTLAKQRLRLKPTDDPDGPSINAKRSIPMRSLLARSGRTRVFDPSF